MKFSTHFICSSHLTFNFHWGQSGRGQNRISRDMPQSLRVLWQQSAQSFCSGNKPFLFPSPLHVPENEEVRTLWRCLLSLLLHSETQVLSVLGPSGRVTSPPHFQGWQRLSGSECVGCFLMWFEFSAATTKTYSSHLESWAESWSPEHFWRRGTWSRMLLQLSVRRHELYWLFYHWFNETVGKSLDFS